MKFIQLIECTVDIKTSRAHARMDAQVDETTGLLGLTDDGKIYRYDYTDKVWNRFHDNQTASIK